MTCNASVNLREQDWPRASEDEPARPKPASKFNAGLAIKEKRALKRERAEDAAHLDLVQAARALKPPPFPDSPRHSSPGAIEARKIARKEPRVWINNTHTAALQGRDDDAPRL